ncbi:MAG: FkbM family methyltransferase [Rhodobacteraceae bacterium]|nr:FkbM family methyltransferase [Paracoccaceae bacterium]
MRTAADLATLNQTTGGDYFGYIDISIDGCPPFVMFLNGHDCWVASNFKDAGHYEPASLGLWCRVAAQASAVIDIGANSGIFSLAAASVNGTAPVLALEPNPLAFARLAVNVAANGAANIACKPVAAADKQGWAPFSWVAKDDGHISPGGHLGGSAEAGAVSVAVPTETISELTKPIALGDRPLVKIDVEGGERLVFEGMGPVLGLRPDILLESFDASVCAQLSDQLAPAGYRFYGINEDSGAIVERARLEPATRSQLNQFLTTRPIPDR